MCGFIHNPLEEVGEIFGVIGREYVRLKLKLLEKCELKVRVFELETTNNKLLYDNRDVRQNERIELSVCRTLYCIIKKHLLKYTYPDADNINVDVSNRKYIAKA